nr:BRO family protein [Pannonibacter phragmitetus]
MTNLTTFTYQVSGGRKSAVRCVEIDGKPWFVLADVRNILNMQRGGNRSYLRDDELHTTTELNGVKLKGSGLSLLSESGLYKLIMRSDKPEARKFQDWVTREVLPAIRKTGRYETHQADAGLYAGTEHTASTDPHAEAIAQTLARHLDHMQRHVVAPLVKLVADLVHKVDAPGNVRSVGIPASPVGQEVKLTVVDDCIPNAGDMKPLYTAAAVKQMVRLVGTTAEVGRAPDRTPSRYIKPGYALPL